MVSTGRPLRSDARRNRELLVESARDLFARRGLDVPLEDIAKGAGVSIGTLYNHFPARTDLVNAAFAEQVQRTIALAEEALEIPDPWAGFVHYVAGICELQAGNRGYNEAACRGLPESGDSDQLRARATELIGWVIARAHTSGALRKDFTTTDLAFIIWGHSRTVESTMDIAPNVWRRHLAFMLDGLRAEAAHPLPEPPLELNQLHGQPGRG